MTEQEEDRLLRRALLDALRLDWEECLEAAPPAARSPRQEKRMRAMLADPVGYARRQGRPLWKKAVRTAAGVLLACGITMATLLAASPTIRAAVVRWMEEVYETFIVYRFAGEASENEMPSYELGYLPEGYEVTEEAVEFRGYFKRIYENAQGQCIYLRCMRMEQGAVMSIGTENMDVTQVTVNGCPGHMYLSEDGETSNGIIWMDLEANLTFTVDGFVDKIDLLHMAESVNLETLPKK